jgi:hypothetical protein
MIEEMMLAALHLFKVLGPLPPNPLRPRRIGMRCMWATI